MSLFDRYAQTPYVDKQLDLSTDAVRATDLHLELDFVDKPAVQTQEMSELDKALREMSGPEFINWVISRVANEDVTDAMDEFEPHARMLDSTLELATASIDETRLTLDGLSDAIALIRENLDAQEADIVGQFSEYSPAVRKNIQVFDDSTARASRRGRTAEVLNRAHEQMPRIEQEEAIGMFRELQDKHKGHPGFMASAAQDKAIEISKKAELIETNIVGCVAEQEHELRLASIAREALGALEPQTVELTSNIRSKAAQNVQLAALIRKATQKLTETPLAKGDAPRQTVIKRFLKSL